MPPPSWICSCSPTAAIIIADHLLVLRPAGDRAVQVDDVQALRALRGPVPGHRHRVLGEDGGRIHVALLQAHAAAVLQINCGNDEHGSARENLWSASGTPVHEVGEEAEAGGLAFSGWNWTAKMLSRATAQVKGTP